jgi:hypothetical protein
MGGCPQQTATVEVEFSGSAARLGEHLLFASSCDTGGHGSAELGLSIACLGSKMIFGTAGALNDGDPFQRRSDDTCVWSIIPADVRQASVYLGKDFPNSHLAGKNHEVVVMDDCDHAGFGVPCPVGSAC